jgi:hypothetical protein
MSIIRPNKAQASVIYTRLKRNKPYGFLQHLEQVNDLIYVTIYNHRKFSISPTGAVTELRISAQQ